MLETCSKEERWAGVDQIIERWLQSRQALIVEFCAISGVHQYTPNTPRSKLRLQKLCQLLVDYVSAGHFEIYYQLIREAEEFQDGSAKLGKALLPLIDESTEKSLAFNDAYATAGFEKPIPGLAETLSQLGETLVSRFEIEDQLIDALHYAHATQVA